MATTGSKRSAITSFKNRHPVLHASVDDAGNVAMRIDALIEGTRDLPLFHAEKNLFHPIAAYGRSITRVSRRAGLFADKLFKLELDYRHTSPSPRGNDFTESYRALLDLYEAFLFSLEAHFDDLKNIPACFWQEPSKKVRSTYWNQFAVELEAISDATAYVVNRIKHNQGTLCAFHSVAASKKLKVIVPGYLLQRVVGESVGPDPDFKGYENSAISFYGDFRRTLITLLAAAEALADFLVSHGVAPKDPIATTTRWNDTLDILFSVSRFVYPSEKHDYLMDTNLSGLHHVRPSMPASIRDGPPPPDLICDDWAAMYEGDGYTRTFRLPRPIQIKNDTSN